MARKLDDILAELPEERLARVEARFKELAALKGLRQAAEKTQVELAAAMEYGGQTRSNFTLGKTQ